MSNWNNLSGRFAIEIEFRDQKVFEFDTDRELPKELLCDAENPELLIHILSSGSYTAKSMYGGPDGIGWPEEFDEERIIDRCEILSNGKVVMTIEDESTKEKLQEEFEDEISEAEIDCDE